MPNGMAFGALQNRGGADMIIGCFEDPGCLRSAASSASLSACFSMTTHPRICTRNMGTDRRSFALQPIAVMESNLPTRALSMVLEWMALHQQELAENWERLHSSRPPVKVAPLT